MQRGKNRSKLTDAAAEDYGLVAKLKNSYYTILCGKILDKIQFQENYAQSIPDNERRGIRLGISPTEL